MRMWDRYTYKLLTQACRKFSLHQLLPELPMLTVLTELPYSCMYTTFWQMHLAFAGAAHEICVNAYTTILSTVAAVISLGHSGKGCKRTCLQKVQPSGFLVRHAFIVQYDNIAPLFQEAR
jgi:hypothetical protein